MINLEGPEVQDVDADDIIHIRFLNIYFCYQLNRLILTL